MGLPKVGNNYGNGVFVVLAQTRCLYTSRVMSTEGKGKQLINNKDLIPENGSEINVKKVKGIYRKMIQIPELKLGYESISRKASANVKGVTNDTLDGFSEEQLLVLHKELKNHSFKFKPIRRIYIPKKNGGMRPLGIPSPRDKIVQKVACNVLEEIYEGKDIFLNCSHGFRPGKSTHSALLQIKG
jgi:retron-type reverse transcriptase